MKKSALSIVMILFAIVSIKAQEKQEIIKTGYNLGPLPIVAFDQDRGFQYGALLNLYNFADGSTYPQAKSQWYFEASAYTKGSQFFVVSYDSKYFIPGIRLSVAAMLSNEKAMDFYGFNGYNSYYDYERVENEHYTPFYRYKRLNPNFKADLNGSIIPGKLYWLAGYHFSWYNIGNINLDNINKGKEESEQFRDETLFEKYKQWGIIPENEADGGFSSALRVGMMLDTRDQEAAPSKGVWAEAIAILAPKFLGTTNPYARYAVTFRQYLPLAGENLVFAYRLNYQGTMSKTAPFYVLPYLNIVGQGFDKDATGGYRTVRGLMRARVQGLDVAFYNAELRWKFVHFQAFKQNISLGLSAFCDGAMVTRKYDMSYRPGTYSPSSLTIYDGGYADYISKGSDEKLHITAGAGFRFIMNRNFIIAIEYGKAFNKQDGNGGLYINTGYLF